MYHNLDKTTKEHRRRNIVTNAILISLLILATSLSIGLEALALNDTDVDCSKYEPSIKDGSISKEIDPMAMNQPSN